MNTPAAHEGPVTPTPFTVIRGGTHLEGECWGDSRHPAVLLIAGTSCTRDWWPSELCERLTRIGVRAIRYDQRDTGASSTWPAGAPAYALTDLADDALAILDAAGAERAHIVGFSQGGWVAQILGLDHPRRVESLTLVSTRPTEHGPADPDLPDLDPKLLAAWSEMPEPDWNDSRDVIDSYVEGERVLAGDSFDENSVRAMCTAAVARSRSPQSAGNHPLMQPRERWRERLGTLLAPTTVIHGTADPLFPAGNARALAASIPNVSLRLVDGVGHELPSRVWDTLVDSIRGRLRPGSNDAPVP